METKRVSDQYKISSPSIVLDGNLTVTGSTTSVETVNSTVKDAIITLNQGEVGAGVTSGTSGIEVDRGSSNSSSFTFNETADVWEAKIGSSYAVLRAATPVDDNDVATKAFITQSVVSVSPGGNTTSIQYNDGATFGGSNDLVWNGSAVIIGQNIILGNTGIGVLPSDSNLEIAANGTGKIYFKNVLRLDNVLSDPTSDAGSNVLFVKTPGNAGSGVYYTNTSSADELVSRTKAILFGLIF